MSVATPSEDARLSAVSGRQIAIIGAIAGIVSALVAVPVTIWSTNAAGQNAIETVRTQLAGETEKSRAEFLRERRRVLYSDVVTAEKVLQDTEDERCRP